MSIIIQSTQEFLAAEWPAVHSWIPCKEQGAAGASDSVIDYARGVELVTDDAVVDKVLSYAVRVAGNSAAGGGYTDEANVGTGLTLAADEHLIALCVAINLNIADTYCGYGTAVGNNSVHFSEAGSQKLSYGTALDIVKPTVTLAGTIASYIGLRRDTNLVEFGSITDAGSIVPVETASAAALAGLSVNLGGGSTGSGLQLYNGAAAASPVGLYNMVIAKFTGDFPAYADFDAELVTWRAAAIAGNKYIPPFLRSLTV